MKIKITFDLCLGSDSMNFKNKIVDAVLSEDKTWACFFYDSCNSYTVSNNNFEIVESTEYSKPLIDTNRFTALELILLKKEGMI